MEENKKKNKSLIVLVVVLSICLVSAVGYICYDKFLSEDEIVDNGRVNNAPSQTDDSEPLVQGNEFKLGDVSCVDDGDSKCVKTIKVAYSNQNHEIKIKSKSDSSNDNGFISHSYLLYIDNNLVDTISAGMNNVVVNDFVGSLYIIDGKYLGYLYQEFSPSGDGYSLNIYNDNVKNVNKEVIVPVAQSIYINATDNVDLSDYSNVEFDGSMFKYWVPLCNSNFTKAGKISLSYDGVSGVKKIVETKDNLIIGGSAYCADDFE